MLSLATGRERPLQQGLSRTRDGSDLRTREPPGTRCRLLSFACRTAIVYACLCFRRTWPPRDGCRSCGSDACRSQPQTFRRTSRMSRVLRADLPIGAALRLDGHDRTRFSNFAEPGWTARSRTLPAGQMIERLNITGRPRQTVPPSCELARMDPILVTPFAAVPPPYWAYS